MGPKYLIIGSGRTASHLGHYFNLLKIPHKTWSRRSSQTFSHEGFSSVLLCLSDSAIQEFYSLHLTNFRGSVLHFSGAHEFEGMISAHPLISFGPQLFDLHFYHKIPFILTKGHLRDYIPELPNRSLLIQPQQKALYHALCVLSGNFTTVLWQKMRQGLEGFNLPTDAANPYLQSIVENLIQNPNQALTGPFARKDELTIEQNIKALQDDPYQQVYLAFQKILFPNYQAKVKP